jgi:hypothetical protein
MQRQSLSYQLLIEYQQSPALSADLALPLHLEGYCFLAPLLISRGARQFKAQAEHAGCLVASPRRVSM